MSLPDITREKSILPQRDLPEGLSVTETDLPKLPDEIKPYLEQQPSAETQLTEQIIDQNGRAVLTNIEPEKVTVSPLLTEEEMKRASRLRTTATFRWLGELAEKLQKVRLLRTNKRPVVQGAKA